MEYEAIDKSYLNCVHCGKCLPVCPTYSVSLNEFYSPRGRIKLVLTDNNNKVPLRAAKVTEAMSACLLCGRCAKVCPNDVKISDLIINEKLKLNELCDNKFSFNRITLDKLALKTLKSKRKVLLRTALKLANIPIVSRFNKKFAPNPEGKSFISYKDRLFKADEITIGNDKLTKNREIKAGYFSGCVFNEIYPQISYDTISSLVKNGVSVFAPASQGCCGLPFISSGDISSFKGLALNNANAFADNDIDYIVTSCASCSYSINKLYPLYFNKSDDGYDKVIEFSKKLLNIWSFFKILEEKGFNIKTGVLKQQTDAVFHIPCHLSNLSGFKPSSFNEDLIGEAGLIADKINGLNIKPLKHNYCCGNGGMFNIRHYDLSKEITKLKLEEIKEVSPENILTSCSGCMFSLRDQRGILNGGDAIPVKHLISLYARSLKD